MFTSSNETDNPSSYQSSFKLNKSSTMRQRSIMDGEFVDCGRSEVAMHIQSAVLHARSEGWGAELDRVIARKVFPSAEQPGTEFEELLNQAVQSIHEKYQIEVSRIWAYVHNSTFQVVQMSQSDFARPEMYEAILKVHNFRPTKG